MATTVGARELETRLGTYVRRVREGATLVVTDRGRPVAELRPIAQARDEPERALAALVERGLVSAPVRSGPLPEIAPARLPGPELSREIVAAREDRV